VDGVPRQRAGVRGIPVDAAHRVPPRETGVAGRRRSPAHRRPVPLDHRHAC